MQVLRVVRHAFAEGATWGVSQPLDRSRFRSVMQRMVADGLAGGGVLAVTEHLFDMADANCDGCVSMHELQAFCAFFFLLQRRQAEAEGGGGGGGGGPPRGGRDGVDAAADIHRC